MIDDGTDRALPPARARRRLRRRLPSHLADEVVFELDERYRSHRARRGRLAAALWYRRQVRGARHGRGPSGPRLEEWLQDLRVGARKLRRRPVLAAALVVSLALGIGANAAIFSVVDQVLLRPLPYPEPDRLRILHTELPLQGTSLPKTSGPELLDLESVEGIESYGGIWFRPGALTDDVAEPEDIGMAFVTAGLLPTLGVEPAIGRWPTATEDSDGGEEAIVLAHHLWQRRYGGDPDIVGTRVEFDGVPHTVVGVMPASFRVLLPPSAGVPAALDAWVPFGGAYDRYPRGWRVFSVVARLADAGGDATAGAALEALAGRLREAHEDYAGSGLAWRLERLSDGHVAHVRPLLTLLSGAVAMMLLIVCANSVNLIAAGMNEGRDEIAVRVALGASGGRLVRQLAAEAAVVVALGAGAGVLLARWGIDLLPRLAPAGLPRMDEIALDARVLGYVAAVSLATVVVFSVASALRLRSGGLTRSLRGGGPGGPGETGRSVVRSGLVVFEVAVCLVLMIGVGLMVQSFAHLARTDPGFDPEGLSTVKVSLVDSNYLYSGPEAIADFYRRLEQRLNESAAIESAGATTLLPFDGGGVDLAPYAYDTVGGPSEWGARSADYRVVTPGFLATIGARFVAGRDFAPTDDLDAPVVVIVDELMARRVWPGESAIGRRLQVERFVRGEWRPEWAEVIGVVEHVRQDPSRPGVEQVFEAHAQVPMRTMTVAIRGDADPRSLLDTVTAVVREVDPDQPTQAIVPMEDYVGEALAPTRFAVTLLGLFAGVAVILALVGTYGVISYTVGRRTRELGIEIALGATPAGVSRRVVAHGARLAGLGVALGLAGAFALSRALAGLLHGVGATDPPTYAAVSLVLCVVALIAAYLPARRAARLDPVAALRAE